MSLPVGSRIACTADGRHAASSGPSGRPGPGRRGPGRAGRPDGREERGSSGLRPGPPARRLHAADPGAHLGVLGGVARTEHPALEPAQARLRPQGLGRRSGRSRAAPAPRGGRRGRGGRQAGPSQRHRRHRPSPGWVPSRAARSLPFASRGDRKPARRAGPSPGRLVGAPIAGVRASPSAAGRGPSYSKKREPMAGTRPIQTATAMPR